MTNRTFPIIIILLLALIKMDADSIPIKLVRKTILIEATVNDVSGYFILDTGTPWLILNNDYFKGRPTGEKIAGFVGGEIDIYEREVTLMVGDLKWDRIDAALLPLNHLSRLKGVAIMGLIGTGVMNRFKLTIDFNALELELVKTNKKSVPERSAHLPDISFEFLWRAGIPVIKTMLGNESLLFVLDTGAGVNALSKRKGRQLAEHLTMNDSVKVIGIDKGGRSLQSGFIRNVIIENYYCPEMKVVLISLDRFKGFGSQLNIVDGFLGYEFLKHFRTVINFKERTIDLYYRNDPAKYYIVAR